MEVFIDLLFELLVVSTEWSLQGIIGVRLKWPIQQIFWPTFFDNDFTTHTVPKIRFMYSHKWNFATLFPVLLFMYLWAIYVSGTRHFYWILNGPSLAVQELTRDKARFKTLDGYFTGKNHKLESRKVFYILWKGQAKTAKFPRTSQKNMLKTISVRTESTVQI